MDSERLDENEELNEALTEFPEQRQTGYTRRDARSLSSFFAKFFAVRGRKHSRGKVSR
jgi:hypothetical protein